MARIKTADWQVQKDICTEFLDKLGNVEKDLNMYGYPMIVGGQWDISGFGQIDGYSRQVKLRIKFNSQNEMVRADLFKVSVVFIFSTDVFVRSLNIHEILNSKD